MGTNTIKLNLKLIQALKNVFEIKKIYKNNGALITVTEVTFNILLLLLF